MGDFANRGVPSGTPLVSVVIPVWNRAHLVTQTLESVFGQTFGDFEVIVVDDGSTDATRQALEPYRMRIRYEFQPNAGPAAARNRGAALASGEYLAFLDSDDCWMPSYLETTLARLRADPAVGLLAAAVRRTTSDGSPTRHVIGKRSPGAVYTTRSLLEGDVGTIGGSAVVRRDAFDRVGGYDTTLRSAEDCDLWLRLSFHTELHHLPEPLLLCRHHAGSLSRDILSNARHWLRILDKLEREHPEFVARHPAVMRKSRALHLLRLGRELVAHSGNEGARLSEARRSLRESIRLEPIRLRAYVYLVCASLPRTAELYSHWRRRELQVRRAMIEGRRESSDGSVSTTCTPTPDDREAPAPRTSRTPTLASAASRSPSPAVSFVVPAYNHARFIRSAIDSLLAQTQPALEVIVVDDGSTDGTKHILRSYGSRIRLFERPHLGIGAAYTFGCEQARGDLVAFVESDDMVEPKYLEAAVSFLLEHPEAAWVTMARRLIDREGRPTGDFHRKASRGIHYTTEGLLLRDMGYAPTPVVRRQALLDVGPFDRRTNLVDSDMAVRFSLRHGMVFLDEPLYLYRRHDDNTSKSPARNSREFISILARLQAEYPDDMAPYRKTLRQSRGFLASTLGVALAEERIATSRAEVLPWLHVAVRSDPLRLKHLRRVIVVALFGVPFYGWWRRFEKTVRSALGIER